jgi:hypothetical protein
LIRYANITARACCSPQRLTRRACQAIGPARSKERGAGYSASRSAEHVDRGPLSDSRRDRRQGTVTFPCRDASRKLLADGIDPSENRKAMKSAQADGKQLRGGGAGVVRQVFRNLGRESRRPHHPALRTRYFPVGWWATNWQVTAPELLAVVRRIETRGALEIAHRALGNCRQGFRTLTVRCALRLAPLVFVGPASSERPNGRISTWTRRNGATPLPRPTPRILSLFPGRLWKSCANCIPSPRAGALFSRERGATGDG